MLRGIAILIVIASHYAGWMYVEPVHVTAHDWIMKWGPVGVDIFFLMSGYGLHKSAERGRHTKSNNSGITFNFVIKRIIGAYIPYLLCVALINTYDGTWKSAIEEGTIREKVISCLMTEGYWYMSVLFTMYIDPAIRTVLHPYPPHNNHNHCWRSPHRSLQLSIS